MLAKAVKYSDRVSRKEKHYIKVAEARVSGGVDQWIKELHKLVERYPEEKEAFLELGNYYSSSRLFEQGIHFLNKAIEIDPLYKLAYNRLAYTYTYMGDFEKSLWAINKCISIAPDEANPYDTRGDIYAWFGKIDQAIQSYKKALEIKPDFYLSMENLGNMYLLKREYVKAESCYQELSSSTDKDTRSWGREYLARIPLYQGKLEEALRVLDDGIVADRLDKVEGWTKASKHVVKAEIYTELVKDFEMALREFKLGQEIYENAYPEEPLRLRFYYVYFLARSGNITKAEEVARTLKNEIQEEDPTPMFAYWWAFGFIEQARGDKKSAVAYFAKAAEEKASSPSFSFRFSLAKAYLESGKLGEAVAEFEKMLSRYHGSRASNTIRAVKAYYLLGLAYEKSGWNKKAIEQYKEFLDIWKNADPEIPEVEDAKERLARLKTES